MPPKKIYKIRNITTGLFKCAGSGSPRWHPEGSYWPSLGALKNHLRLTRINDNGNWVPLKEFPEDDWEVLEYRIIVTDGWAVRGFSL